MSKFTQATPLYRAIILELERRRQAAGISMDEMSELMGTAERSYAKMLYCETPSGRIAGWDTMQKAVDVLYCEGFDVRIVRTTGERLTTEGTRRKIRQSTAFYDRKAMRERMSEIGHAGRAQQLQTQTPKQRSKIARNAALRRWRTPKLVEITGQG